MSTTTTTAATALRHQLSTARGGGAGSHLGVVNPTDPVRAGQPAAHPLLDSLARWQATAGAASDQHPPRGRYSSDNLGRAQRTTVLRPASAWHTPWPVTQPVPATPS